MRRTTIKDVAKAAGVSANTVSRAINNKSDISGETRKRILEIASKMNYTPNQLARSLQTRKSGVIGTVIANMIKAIESYAYQKGYNVMVCNTSENEERESKALRMLHEKNIDGLLVVPVKVNEAYLEKLDRMLTPYILLNRPSQSLSNHNYVINDNRVGAGLAIDHLVNSSGKKDLIYLCGP